MYGVAMVKNASSAYRIERHTQRPKEIALNMQGAVLSFGVHDACKHYGAYREGKPKRPSPEMVVDDHQRNAKNNSHADHQADVITVNEKGQSGSEQAYAHRPKKIKTIDRGLPF